MIEFHRVSGFRKMKIVHDIRSLEDVHGTEFGIMLTKSLESFFV